MHVLDDWILGLGGGGLTLGLVVALLLGARHATDPDHLTAVSTLILSDDRRGGRRAGGLGLFWGLGHATTLFLFGLPIVMFGAHLPAVVGRAAEFLVGVVTAYLAIRLLVRWRRGYFHSHPHSHGRIRHTHPHVHEHAIDAGHPAAHPHHHADRMGRSPAAAFGIGLIHGLGGSAGVGILLVASVADRMNAVAGLLLRRRDRAVDGVRLRGGRLWFGQGLGRPAARTRGAGVWRGRSAVRRVVRAERPHPDRVAPAS
jgi:ABC-type nickel/cobalt efflux system permease component RcnA